MKLNKFDYKLPQDETDKKKRMMVILISVVVCIVITLASSYAYYQSIELQNPYDTKVGEFNSGDVIFAVTIDGETSSAFPSKGTGYIVSSVTCDKGATGKWDNNLWNIEVGNLTQSKTTCNIAFVNESGTLAYKVLQQYGGKEAINEAPANTFASVSTSTTNIMYKMKDDYGTSYYYRGAKNLLNNNLIFANHQWKIVRVNGDGSVRIIYNGTCPNNSCTINSTGTATQIKETAFNTNSNDNKYVGYMYGGANGVASTSRAQAVTNETSSNAKIELESWYTTNIENRGYSAYISDTLFCNDRRLRSEVGGSATGTGFGTSNTYYAAYHRVWTNKTPTLLCGNKNDKFTVSDTVNGNGDLDKPVGLITADEAALAGGVHDTDNESHYLHTNQHFWMFSSSYMFSSHASMFLVGNTGGWGVHYVDIMYGLRSVINLNSDVQVTGSGSPTDPFKLI